MNIQGVTMTSPSIRITVPPERVRDLQKLMALESGGFIPFSSVHYDGDERAFVAELDGDMASHLLDLLAIAMDTRDAETWNERVAREMSQLRLQLAAEDVPYVGTSRPATACDRP